jgi:predicted small lipoprotein YifL
MKSLFMTAAVVIAAIALGGCPDKRPEPIPGPQSARAESAPTSTNERDDDTRRTATTRGHGVSEISWFQGTLEEAFSRTTCHERRALFRY